MTDCRNPAGEAYGINRLKLSLANLNRATAQADCGELFEKLMKYQDGSKQEDDVTLLTIQTK
jgi:serine phosphatase RsbU (regulator of sigma subunit)